MTKNMWMTATIRMTELENISGSAWSFRSDDCKFLPIVCAHYTYSPRCERMTLVSILYTAASLACRPIANCIETNLHMRCL